LMFAGRPLPESPQALRPGGSVPPSSELHIGVWTGRKVTTFPKIADKNESAEHNEPSTMRIQRQHHTSPTKRDRVPPRPFREARSILATCVAPPTIQASWTAHVFNRKGLPLRLAYAIRH
jgi:hypothetical protein